MSDDVLDRLSVQTLDDLYGVMDKLEDSILKSSPETGDVLLDSLITKIATDESLDLAKSRTKLLLLLKDVKKLEIVMSTRPSKSLLNSLVKKARSQLGQVVLDISYDQDIFAGFVATFQGKKYNYALDRNVKLT